MEENFEELKNEEVEEAKKAAEADIMVGAGHIITAEAAEDQHISAVCPAV